MIQTNKQMNFCFTVDDNIRFFQEIAQREAESIFEHPYLAMYRRLHKKYNLKVQLNLFYQTQTADFDLSHFPNRYQAEWTENADWLKLSFHAKTEKANPYLTADYDEVFDDCNGVHREILRFAGADSLAKTTTVHYCQVTADGLLALWDNGIQGLLGLYGTVQNPHRSYQTSATNGDLIRAGKIVKCDGIAYTGIDLVINTCKKEAIAPQLASLLGREKIKVMIHEQYFYPDYRGYQSDFEKKLDQVFDILMEHGYNSCFFEEWL